jgi:GNAT superfamily N-acetyltransferase
VALIIRPLDPDTELDAYLAVCNQVSDIQLTVADWWQQEQRVRPGRPNRHLVGEHYGRIVAVAFVGDSQMSGDAVVARVIVDRDQRNRGHGRSLAAAVEEQVAALDAAVVTTAVRDDDLASKAWAERRGFVVFDHVFESRLDLAPFEPTAHRWAIEGAERAGLRIEPAVGGDRLYQLVVDLFADVPAVDLDPPSRDEFQQNVLGRDGTLVLVARDGDAWVGLTIVVQMAEGGGWNWLTGVRREYRGQGLARALKVAAIEEARRRGMRWLGAGNNAVNGPMLAVNDALGYERLAGLLWLRRPAPRQPAR